MTEPLEKRATSLYALLGLTPEATDEDIKDAYYKLAKTYHPDQAGDGDSDEAFKLITRAAEILRDPEKRGLYDSGEIDEAGFARPAAGQKLRRREYRAFAIAFAAAFTLTAAFAVYEFKYNAPWAIPDTATPKPNLAISAELHPDDAARTATAPAAPRPGDNQASLTGGDSRKAAREQAATLKDRSGSSVEEVTNSETAEREAVQGAAEEVEPQSETPPVASAKDKPETAAQQEPKPATAEREAVQGAAEKVKPQSETPPVASAKEKPETAVEEVTKPETAGNEAVQGAAEEVKPQSETPPVASAKERPETTVQQEPKPETAGNEAIQGAAEEVKPQSETPPVASAKERPETAVQQEPKPETAGKEAVQGAAEQVKPQSETPPVASAKERPETAVQQEPKPETAGNEAIQGAAREAVVAQPETSMPPQKSGHRGAGVITRNVPPSRAMVEALSGHLRKRHGKRPASARTLLATQHPATLLRRVADDWPIYPANLQNWPRKCPLTPACRADKEWCYC